MTRVLLLLIFLPIFLTTKAQNTERIMTFPDVPGYKSLKCDFHIHTVFSDGSVWPDIRIQEAVRDGLDAISLTEHIEYQPHKDDIPHPDRNRSYELAKELAKPHGLLVIHGAEITRDLPPGHANALFIQDANKLIHDEAIDAYRAAKAQGAFVFWNHPNWIQQKEDGLPEITPFHQKLIDEDLLHGMEVVNDLTYSEHGLEVAIEHGITPLGTSDIHGLVDWQYGLANGGHRPIAIVFASERSEQAIKEALFEGRVVSWFNDILIGEETIVSPLIKASLSLKDRGFIGPSSVQEIIVENISSAKMIIQNKGDFGFYNQTDVIVVPPKSKVMLQVLTEDGKIKKELTFEILSAVIGKQKHPEITFSVE